MKYCVGLQLLLAIVSMSVGTMGKYYRDSVHRSHDIIGNDVTINVISEIPGTLKWIPTNKSYLSIIVKVTATSFENINTTDIMFSSDNYSVSLEIRTASIQEPAAVHSTGSRTNWLNGSSDFAIVLLLWTTCIVLDLKWAHAVLIVLFFQVFVSGSFNIRELAHSVEIVIKAPRHFRYKDINLEVNNGTVRITDEIFRSTQEVRCNTDQRHTVSGCDNCCYGNGVCFNNTCLCDDNFDSEENCKIMKKRDILYASPYDPRLSRTILPSGMVLDLTPARNSKGYSQRNLDQSNLRVRPRGGDFKDSILHFERNGFLKRVRQDKMTLLFRRKKHAPCQLQVIIKKERLLLSYYTFDMCMDAILKHRAIGAHTIFNRVIPEIDTELTNGTSDISENLYDIPIKFERCGHNAQNDVSIYFKLNQETKSDKTHPNHNKHAIYMRTEYRTNRHYLKIPTGNISEKEIQRKCQRSFSVHKNICKQDYLTLYSYICDKITATEAINENTQHNTSRSALREVTILCNFLTQTLQSFCSFVTSINEGLPCPLRFTESVDIYADGHVTLTPFVVFQNGETITKDDVIIQVPKIHNSSLKEIVLQENVPEFKVIDVVVIPKDPVPQDIYKVRLDYACATNTTVIFMNVTGSDKYSSHVTCQGITECNCCSVHAAGAADAVIDYVSISITDELAHTNIHREMVVIF